MFLPILALVAGLAQAAPNLVYPLMDQEPPVARIGKPFLFDLLPSTFSSTSNITYTTSSLPSWLAFDPYILLFYGTPSTSDAGQSAVTVTAADNTGSTTSDYTLIVTTYSSPDIHESFTTQIANPPLRVFASASALTGSSGVSIPPYWSFSLGFAYDTFRQSFSEPNNGELYFAAHQRGKTGLPSWLEFNNDSFTFNGVAPGNGTYTIVATGTDFWGYSAALTSFIIEVGEGEAVEMMKGENFTDLVTMARSQVDYKVDLSKVTLGGQAVSASDVVLSLDNSGLPWLSLDRWVICFFDRSLLICCSSTNTLTGTTPDQYLNGTITPFSVPITISPADTTSTLSFTTWLGMDILPSFFTTFSIPTVTANPSQSFSFSLTPYLHNHSAPINTTVNPTDASQWLVWYPSNLTLAGSVPKSVKYSEVDVTFQAMSAGLASTVELAAVSGNALTSSTELKITMAGVAGSSSSTATAGVPTSGTSRSSGHGGLSKGAKIALAVVFGLLGVIALLMLLLLCCRRRKTKAEEKEKDDADSFVAGSPVQDPFRRSDGLGPPRNLLGEIARVSGFHIRQGSDAETTIRPMSAGTGTTAAENPKRLDGLKGIFGWSDVKEKEVVIATPRLGDSSSSFVGSGDIIGVSDAVNRPSQDASSFTESFDSSGSSRASWESQRSFRWSSAENVGGMRNRESTTPSIPRPRENFTPRYPRNSSPTVLARLTSQHTLDGSQGFSEFGSQEDSGTHASRSMFGSGSNFPSGPSGLGRFGDSGFKSIDEDDVDATSVEGAAVVSMAERQSFETRQSHATEQRPTPKLRPSRERILSARQTPPTEQSRNALAGSEEGVYDDADEARRSTYAPSDVTGSGNPASTIFFGTPNPDGEYDQRSSVNPSEARSSTIRAIPTHQMPLSPPLPQVGSFIRHRRTNTSGSGGGSSRPGSGSAGRVLACANETFSIHPPIHPPPTVSLSAATWSSNPQSTYRAEVQGGGAMPAWLHFDAREHELWGVPSLKHAGETTVVRIIEKLPSNNRRSDPMAFGYEPPQEREVGKVIIE